MGDIQRGVRILDYGSWVLGGSGGPSRVGS